MGEKGSLKNKIKDFFKIQKKLQKKKQEETKLKEKQKSENEKIKKYSRPRIFFTMVGGYLGTVLTSLIIPKSKKPEKKTIKEIGTIEKEVENTSLPAELDLLKQQTINIQNGEKEKSILFEKTTYAINEIDEKKENLINNNHIKKEKMLENIKNQKPKIKIKLIELEKQIDKASNLDDLKNIEREIDELIKKCQDCDYRLKLKDRITSKRLNLEANLNIKKENIFSEKTDDIETKKSSKRIIPTLMVVGGLGTHLIQKGTQEIVESVRFQHNDDNMVKDNHYQNDNTDEISKLDISKNMDTKNIILPEEPRQGKIEETILVPDNIKEDKDIEEENLDDFYISANEISLAHEKVEKEIMIQEEDIIKIKNELEKLDSESNKKSLFAILGATAKRVFNTALSLSPLLIFKNKLVGGIVSSIFLNHRVKKLRKLSKTNDTINYYNVKELLKQIDSKKDAIIKNIDINVDTLDEITKLKRDILKVADNNIEKYPEIIEIMVNLNRLEKKIEDKNRQLKQQLEKVKELEQKGKTKVKKMKV